MKNILPLWLLCGWLFPFSQLVAQSVTFQKIYGGTGNEVGNHVIATADGYLIAGQAPSPTNGGLDAYLLKVNANGNILWQNTYGGNQDDAFTLVTAASDGGFLAMGDTRSTGAGGRDIFLVKVTADGFVEWTKTFGNSDDEVSPTQAKIVRLDDGYFVSGYQANIGGGSSISFFVRLLEDGTVVWERTLTGASNFLVGNYVAGNTIYTGGSFNNDGCFAKIDANTGDILFLRSFPQPFNDALYNVRPTQDGNLLLSDGTWSATDGTVQRQWVMKTTPDGTVLWSKTYGKDGINLRGVANNVSDGGFILAPYTGGFNAASDANLVRISATGGILWSYSYGGPSDDQFWNAIETSDGGFIAVGSTYHPGSSENDILLVKTNAEGLVQGCTPHTLNLSVVNMPTVPSANSLNTSGFVNGVNWNPTTESGTLAALDYCIPPPDDTLSGIINDYTPITAFHCDSTLLEAGSAAAFSVGDKVLIIQMQGAAIDVSNSESFGTVNNSGCSGNYEFNRIQSIDGTGIQMKFALTKSYDVAGKVQLIRVPEHINLTVGNLTCQPWDGTTGGVLVVDIANTLTLSGDVDVSSKGFRGGIFVNDTHTSYHETQFYYPVAPNLAAAKGEGIALTASDQSYGRGRAANGGGGGNAANAGGGGGANAGNGGHGGEEYYNTPSAPTAGTQGLGGNKAFENNPDRIIMGGGGGAGHSNDFQGSSGGNGGGIIILQAKKIVSNNHTLYASGEDILGPGGTSVNDGQGGGGAGGTILLDAETIEGSLLCDAHGGRGGDCLFYVTSQIIGPGGGGSGGKVMTSQTFPALLFNVNGGVHGIANQSLSNKSQNGESGQFLTGLVLPAYNLLPAIELSIMSPACGNPGQITVLHEPNHIFSLNNGPFQSNPTFNNLEAGQYIITASDSLNQCTTRDSIIILTQVDSITRIFAEVLLCPNRPVVINGITYTQPATIIDTLPAGANGCDTIAIYHLSTGSNPVLHRTISLCPGEVAVINGITYAAVDTTIFYAASANIGCDTLIDVHLQYLPQPPSITKTITFCPGESVVINGISYTQPDTVMSILPAPGCDTMATYILQLASPPTVNIGNDTTINLGDSLLLNAVLLNAGQVVQYEWRPSGSITCPACPITFAQPVTSTIFSLYISDNNGCMSYDSRAVIVKKLPVFIPNVFAPDAGNENDHFTLYASAGVESIELLQIYDRWGSLVFENQRFAPSAGQLGWDGKIGGQAAAAGVYAYLIQVRLRDGTRQLFKGDVTLIR